MSWVLERNPEGRNPEADSRALVEHGMRSSALLLCILKYREAEREKERGRHTHTQSEERERDRCDNDE